MTSLQFLSSIFKEASDVKYTIHTSDIHGSGVFASKDIVIGEIVDLILEGIDNDTSNKYIRTPLGLYINHTSPGNSKLVRNGNNYYLIATKFINKEDEILTSYSDYQQLIQEEFENENKAITVL